MPAYFRRRISEFLKCSPLEVMGELQAAYAADGFATQYTLQTKAWIEVVPLLQEQFDALVASRPDAQDWTLLLEYPLYRLRRRVDAILIAGDVIVVVECKVGASRFAAEDRRQVEEYALDLRDFHAASRLRRIIPVLWSTNASTDVDPSFANDDSPVSRVTCVGSHGLDRLLTLIPCASGNDCIVPEEWDVSPYRPVPSVIEAASIIFSGHDVRSIANADADNLQSAAARLVDLIQEARRLRRRYLLLLTGVPGSGKTLAGLHVVHSSIACGVEEQGDIVYLSGNTPLVAVLREALARDESRRRKATGSQVKKLADIRRDVRARIQHINDFLQQSLSHEDAPPHEHVIVFDEAQRAWDAKQGEEKFRRKASEPSLLLGIMERHKDWCVCVCLVGGGQEINSGEEGVLGWGEALRLQPPESLKEWTVVGPTDVMTGGASAGSFTLGQLPLELQVRVDDALQLRVPQRCYRSPVVSEWVNCVLAGDQMNAHQRSKLLGDYPLVLTRDLNVAKQWLRRHSRGERRFGFVASSGARRLRADGLGVLLHANAGAEIAHWYLNPPGDIRSSFALEVPANEYTCQGLELDLVGVCWGGDFLWNASLRRWSSKRLSGPKWQTINVSTQKAFLLNKYRVLLTRAREGMVVWVPKGDDSDPTRECKGLDATASFLVQCGVVSID